jgi:hypothetical protein
MPFHIAPKKKAQRGKIRRMRGATQSSSFYPSTWERCVQTVVDSVSKMNRCSIQLKNKVVVELWKSIII